MAPGPENLSRKVRVIGRNGIVGGYDGGKNFPQFFNANLNGIINILGGQKKRGREIPKVGERVTPDP